MRAETTVMAYNKKFVHVEMNCAVKFDNDGAIAALYCCQRDMSNQKRYEALLGGSRAETDFMFNQPFVGFALLSPHRPLEFPKAEDTDAALDAMLKQIVILRANQAMLNIRGTEKARFLMKPLTELFPDGNAARQALKELFVMRTTSLEMFGEEEPNGGKLGKEKSQKSPEGKPQEGKPQEGKSPEEKPQEGNSQEGKLRHVSIFQANFDDAGRLIGVSVVTSKHSDGYKARHHNKKI
jgi:hypothetical protein